MDEEEDDHRGRGKRCYGGGDPVHCVGAHSAPYPSLSGQKSPGGRRCEDPPSSVVRERNLVLCCFVPPSFRGAPLGANPESRGDGREIPGSCFAGPGMTETSI